ncbi:MAG: methyltransferase domain-containing protein [Calditrichaeota bacterium]|nr:methyltransferase domain-containing protein [Calditrichota bacterium]
MDLRILKTICCPGCKGALSAVPFNDRVLPLRTDRGDHVGESGAFRRGDVLENGALLCEACKAWFPVYFFVPVLLLFRTRFHDAFCRQFAEQMERLQGYSPPAHLPRPGERHIQDAFTAEWQLADIGRDSLSFTYTLDDLVALNREVWLKDISPLEAMHIVLDAGCGVGMEALALRRLLKRAEVFAVDLNFALLKSGPAFVTENQIHLLVASLFDLPFREGSFDLVYCQGVLHHTFSTRAAFDSISRYVRNGGYLFVWVYGLEDHLVPKGKRGCLARVKHHAERLLRPVISRLPGWCRLALLFALAWAVHPVFRKRMRHKEAWTLRHTRHSLHDWLSPRYAHRHGYNEAVEWFEEAGYELIGVQSPAAYRRLFGRRLFGVGLVGKREIA